MCAQNLKPLPKLLSKLYLYCCLPPVAPLNTPSMLVTTRLLASVRTTGHNYSSYGRCPARRAGVVLQSRGMLGAALTVLLSPELTTCIVEFGEPTVCQPKDPGRHGSCSGQGSGCCQQILKPEPWTPSCSPEALTVCFHLFDLIINDQPIQTHTPCRSLALTHLGFESASKRLRSKLPSGSGK